MKGMIEWTDEESAFMDSCDEFKDYADIDEFISDIRKLLMIGILNNYRYTQEEANELIYNDIHMKWIERDFANKTDACFCAVNIAYCCG